MKSEHKIKMVLTSEKELKKDILIKEDPTTNYIILQNHKYQVMMEEMTNEVVTLKRQVEEQEDEIESLTKGKTCLQGYVKNEYEYAQNWKQLATCHQKIVYKMINYTSLIITAYTALMLSAVLMNDLTMIRAFIGICTLVFAIYYTNESINIYKILKTDDIERIKKQILKIEKSNEYIQDLIDNI